MQAFARIFFSGTLGGLADQEPIGEEEGDGQSRATLGFLCRAGLRGKHLSLFAVGQARCRLCKYLRFKRVHVSPHWLDAGSSRAQRQELSSGRCAALRRFFHARAVRSSGSRALV